MLCIEINFFIFMSPVFISKRFFFFRSKILKKKKISIIYGKSCRIFFLLFLLNSKNFFKKKRFPLYLYLPHNFCKRSILRSAFSHPKVSKLTASNIRIYARFCCRQCAPPSYTQNFQKLVIKKKNKKGGVENLNKNVAWCKRRKNKILFLAVKYG